MHNKLLLRALSVIHLTRSIYGVCAFISYRLLISNTVLRSVTGLRRCAITSDKVTAKCSIGNGLLNRLAVNTVIIRGCTRGLGVDRGATALLRRVLVSRRNRPRFNTTIEPSFVRTRLLSRLSLVSTQVCTVGRTMATATPSSFSNGL